jgi:putative PIN family toxin of toxin-antitoxin system
MDSKLFAVIDTNVLVSALITNKLTTPPLVVLAHVYSGDITPVFNDEIIQEYHDVLSREKFHLDPTDIDKALRVFLDYGLNLNRTKVDDETFSDPKDIVFYEVKMSKEDAYLVTGNIKHFPRKPFVVTPREMVEILEKVV